MPPTRLFKNRALPCGPIARGESVQFEETAGWLALPFRAISSILIIAATLSSRDSTHTHTALSSVCRGSGGDIFSLQSI